MLTAPSSRRLTQGYAGPVVEARDKFAAHLDLALQSFDDSDDLREIRLRRHEIDEADPAAVGRKGRLEDQGARSVASFAARASLGANLPVSVVLIAE
jgi:hypothetical protein